jgi:hypothetical protein
MLVMGVVEVAMGEPCHSLWAWVEWLHLPDSEEAAMGAMQSRIQDLGVEDHHPPQQLAMGVLGSSFSGLKLQILFFTSYTNSVIWTLQNQDGNKYERFGM